MTVIDGAWRGPSTLPGDDVTGTFAGPNAGSVTDPPAIVIPDGFALLVPPSPVPPGPGLFDIPFFAFGSMPAPAPAAAAPEPDPIMPLPDPGPLALPVPPPDPPRPLSPVPFGDNAIEPLSVREGAPKSFPGLALMKTACIFWSPPPVPSPDPIGVASGLPPVVPPVPTISAGLPTM